MYGVGTGGGRSGVRVQDKQDKLKETLSNTQDKAKKKKYVPQNNILQLKWISTRAAQQIQAELGLFH